MTDGARVYEAWDIIGRHLEAAANEVADKVGPDVLEFIIDNARELDSFVREALAKEATLTTYEEAGR